MGGFTADFLHGWAGLGLSECKRGRGSWRDGLRESDCHCLLPQHHQQHRVNQTSHLTLRPSPPPPLSILPYSPDAASRETQAPCAPFQTVRIPRPSSNTLGELRWSQLEVVGSSGGKWSDATLAYAAGAVEGRISSSLIYWHWLNTVSGYCDDVQDYCNRLRTFLTRNWAWMLQQIALRPNDPYWHQVDLVLHQLAGLVDGFFQDVKRPHTDINVDGFLFSLLLLHHRLSLLRLLACSSWRVIWSPSSRPLASQLT